MARERKPPAPRTVPKTNKYDPKHCDAVVAFMGQGYSLTAFAGEVGVSRETLTRWRKRHRAFDTAVKTGEAVRAKALEKKLLAAESGASVSAHVFALRCAVPEEWRDKGSQAAEAEVPMKLELTVRFV